MKYVPRSLKKRKFETSTSPQNRHSENQIKLGLFYNNEVTAFSTVVGSGELDGLYTREAGRGSRTGPGEDDVMARAWCSYWSCV